ncbi:diacylglycerol kinase family protein [Metamycoplasma neophronis]|uniref:Transcriptional regulator n=1 Tax=Metamycoplasma neophronis TaxID=872983 RepID=A0ABY2Z0X6_9BACT|nr:diacylglycerol kinase family protein [Metamycoplasma neophronis]TPR54304.1 transcriptional regulator [Metamycoplasma neophronis]
MLYIFYNSFSKSGSNQRKMYKIVSEAVKVFMQPSLKVIDLVKITDPAVLINDMSENDIVLLIGGDGTLTHVANEIAKYDIKPKIYAYRAGTGNDFLRDLFTIKECEIIKKRFYYISPFIKNLPTVKVNEEKMKFLNGAGFGIDAYIAKYVNEEKKRTGHASFLKTAYNAFKTFKTYDKLKIIADGHEYIFENVWVISIMNGKYYGGGMKIAPNANREGDYLSITIIHNISKYHLPLLFLSVYSGKHIIYKKYVKQIFAKNIKIECPQIELSQIDGETYPVQKKLCICQK